MIVVIQPVLCVPQEPVNALGARYPPSVPDLSLSLMPKETHDLGRLHFHKVEKRIQADRIVVDYIHAKWAEAVRLAFRTFA